MQPWTVFVCLAGTHERNPKQRKEKSGNGERPHFADVVQSLDLGACR